MHREDYIARPVVSPRPIRGGGFMQTLIKAQLCGLGDGGLLGGFCFFCVHIKFTLVPAGYGAAFGGPKGTKAGRTNQ